MCRGNPIQKPQGDELRMYRHQSKRWVILNRVTFSSVEIETHDTVNTSHISMTQLEDFHTSSTGEHQRQGHPLELSTREIISRQRQQCRDDFGQLLISECSLPCFRGRHHALREQQPGHWIISQVILIQAPLGKLADHPQALIKRDRSWDSLIPCRCSRRLAGHQRVTPTLAGIPRDSPDRLMFMETGPREEGCNGSL